MCEQTAAQEKSNGPGRPAKRRPSRAEHDRLGRVEQNLRLRLEARRAEMLKPVDDSAGDDASNSEEQRPSKILKLEGRVTRAWAKASHTVLTR